MVVSWLLIILLINYIKASTKRKILTSNQTIDIIHINIYPMNIRINCFHYCSKNLISTVKLNCTEINMINNLTFIDQENRNVSCCQTFRISKSYEEESRRILKIEEYSYFTRLECKMMLTTSEGEFSLNLLRLNASTTISLYRPENDTLDKLKCSVIKPPIQEKFEIKLQWISPGFQFGPIVRIDNFVTNQTTSSEECMNFNGAANAVTDFIEKSTPHVEVYVGAPGVYSCRCALSYSDGSKKFRVLHQETIGIPVAKENGVMNDGPTIYILITVVIILLGIAITVICRKIRIEKRERSRMRKRLRCPLHKHYPQKSKSYSTLTVTASDTNKTEK